jgi:hypothetical protein
MFEFNKVMKDYESLNAIERGLMLTEKSVSILAKLSVLDIDGIDPVETLASFIIGSVVADGKLHEKEYLLIYPALVKVFGSDFDYESIKKEFEADKDGRKDIAGYTTDLLRVLGTVDETLYEDVIILCLCVVTIDGKVSLREKNYVKRLIA